MGKALAAPEREETGGPGASSLILSRTFQDPSQDGKLGQTSYPL